METRLPDTRKDTAISEKVMFLAWIVVLAFGLTLLSRNIHTWFVGRREDNNALYSVFARNHIYYGLGHTKLFHTYGTTKEMPAKPERYLNNPPLLGLWVGGAMYVFGDHEWVGRMVPIATTLGGAWILMIMISRLQSPMVGLLTGLFYLTLPMTAYFGRIVEYTSPTQFFSLLMLHGYLQWTGVYGNGYGREAGAVWYVLGTVLGIGTGWAAAIMAGLIWLWHIRRAFLNHSSRQLLWWLTAIPAVSLTAVLVHILYGCNWNFRFLADLFLSRAFGSNIDKPIFWLEWAFLNWGCLTGIFSEVGIGAAIIYTVVIIAILRYTKEDSALRQIVKSKVSIIPIFLTLLQGSIWVIVFRQQSGTHEYWWYFISPFIAVAIASVILTVFSILSKRTPHFAVVVAIILMFVPIPFFIVSTEQLYLNKWSSDETLRVIPALKKLDELIPARTAVMVSEDHRNVTIRDKQLDNYAKRPLIFSRDINEIAANQQDCAAYLLEMTNDPNTYQLAQKLGEKYKLAGVERNYMIFLLNPSERYGK